MEAFNDLIEQATTEWLKEGRYGGPISLTGSPQWKMVRNWPDSERVLFACWLMKSMDGFKSDRSLDNWNSAARRRQRIQQAFVDSIFRNNLLMTDEEASLIIDAFIHYQESKWAEVVAWPITQFLTQLEKQRAGIPLSEGLREALSALTDALKAVRSTVDAKLLKKIANIIFNSGAGNAQIPRAGFHGEDDFSLFANPWLRQLSDHQNAHWVKVLSIAHKAAGGKPSAKYLEQAAAAIKELGTDVFKPKVNEWLRFLADLKVKQVTTEKNFGSGQTYLQTSNVYITAINAESVKGLVWMCSLFHDAVTIQNLADLADKAFKKIPGEGATNLLIGNACLFALYKSKGLDGIGRLSRLRLRVMQASTQGMIDKYLSAAAVEKGVTVSEIEDMAVDDCKLIHGERIFSFGDIRMRLTISGVGSTMQQWTLGDGSPQKSVPVAVKTNHAAALKKMKTSVKLVEQTLVTQRDRLDRMFRDARKITWENFQRYYLEHGLMSWLTQKIIWTFHERDREVSAIRIGDQWTTVQDQSIDIGVPLSVSLWHPVLATTEEVRGWRDLLIKHQIQQPLKQAFREVYILTPAEMITRNYSNRMAAHILRQHQFNSLAKSRGWRYALLGDFDNGGREMASLPMPKHRIRAEYWISPVEINDGVNNTGFWNYVGTDQIRFINDDTDELIDLVDVDPVMFSEIMRDADLFVGVASVGNDPQWMDVGSRPAHRDYWTGWSFGELSEIAKSRKEILADLLPRLKIRDIATIRDRFVIVKGKIRTYKIHIGSTNILMEPNDQYLCIVPDRSASGYLPANQFIPTEGDTGLSIILSKAFLLADDDKISDPMILSQLGR